GTQPLALTLGMGFSLNHFYGTTGIYTVTVTVTDDDGGVGTASFSVNVGNVAPTLTVIGNQHVTAEKAFTFAPIGTFTDLNFGPAEAYTYSISWGDGTATDTGAATITTPGSPGVPTAGSFAWSHTYLHEGN